jgi:hypothetical protein
VGSDERVGDKLALVLLVEVVANAPDDDGRRSMLVGLRAS